MATESNEASKVKSTSGAAASGKNADSYQVAVPLLNIRQKASLASEIIGTLQEGDAVEIKSRTPQGFGRLADGDGYVKLEFLAKAAALPATSAAEEPEASGAADA